MNEQLSESQVGDVLNGFGPLGSSLNLVDIANSSVTPEKIVEDLLQKMPCPAMVRQAKHDATYRVALHSVVQVLMLVGPVMAEWQKLNFASTFEMPRQAVTRLNEITKQLSVLGIAGQAAADERYELTYRDYLLQRFHRVEAGTVRMTSNLAVDLSELFVMPRVLVKPKRQSTKVGGTIPSEALMNLDAARLFFGSPTMIEGPPRRTNALKEEKGIPALEQIKRSPRNIIIGAPGSGKSTFLEWLQSEARWSS